MEKTNRYVLCKKENSSSLVYFNYEVLDGYKFKPKSGAKYNGVKVNEMMIINPSFIEKVLKRKIKRKLETYLQFLITLLDEGNEDPTSLRHALTDLDRYRRIVINKYRNYLDKKYIDLLLKKMDVLEKEIKSKLMVMLMKPTYEEEYEQERRRGR